MYLWCSRHAEVIYDNFIRTVSDKRKIPLEEVRKIADRSSVLGERAKELGLIDEIGGQNEFNAYLKEKIGEDVEICW
jgi:protease-4